jgi:hypothetical protein
LGQTTCGRDPAFPTRSAIAVLALAASTSAGVPPSHAEVDIGDKEAAGELLELAPLSVGVHAAEDHVAPSQAFDHLLPARPARRDPRVGIDAADLCGGGSHLVHQLPHLGITKFVIVDPDIIETRNRNRLLEPALVQDAEALQARPARRRQHDLATDVVAVRRLVHVRSLGIPSKFGLVRDIVADDQEEEAPTPEVCGERIALKCCSLS